MTHSDRIIVHLKEKPITIPELYELLPDISQDTIRARVSEMNRYKAIKKVNGMIFWLDR
jgi:DNA-binding HxlR family transcriptional regulator